MSKIKNIKRSVKNHLANGLIFKIATSAKLQETLHDMKQHFEASDSWALSYEYHRESSGLIEMEFNILLELLQYKVQYNRESASIVFRPRSN